VNGRPPPLPPGLGNPAPLSGTKQLTGCWNSEIRTKEKFYLTALTMTTSKKWRKYLNLKIKFTAHIPNPGREWWENVLQQPCRVWKSGSLKMSIYRTKVTEGE
jgi:hypothetical protein